MNSFSNITRLSNGKTRLITAENVYGEKGKGGMARQTTEPQPEVVKIGQVWEGPNPCAIDLGDKWKIRPCITLPAGSVTTIMDFEGPGTITHIWMAVHTHFYRDVILRMYWDDEETPSVETPIGDFFGCPWCKNINIYAIPINVNPSGGLNCYFPMPFRKRARVTVKNRNQRNCRQLFYSFN